MELAEALSELPIPKLFVFDLDFTLWPFWCDTHVVPPFRTNIQDQVVDRCNYVVELYKDVIEILAALKKRGLLIAAASRTSATDTAKELLQMLGVDEFFDFKEIYPGSKLKHFSKFQENSKIEYEDMIFFDDERRNIVEVAKLGVTAVYVEHGLTADEFKNGIGKYRKNLQIMFSKKLEKK